MHFWSPNALAAALAQGRVSQRQQCFYLLATFALSWVWGLLSFFRDGARSAFWWLEGFSALLVLVYAAGTWVAFKIHQKGRADGFIAAYVCLGVPAAIRAAVVGTSLFCVLIVAVALGTERYSREFSLVYDSMGYSLALLIHGLYFYFMWTAIKIASVPTGAPSPPAG